MAICDSAYKFTYIDIGAYGSESDANVFASSQFGKDYFQGKIDFPPNSFINDIKTPFFFFVGDDAFPMSKRLMKPYGGKTKLKTEVIIFNYRLSRARRCIENAFGILSTKWLCLRRTLLCGPDRAQKIIAACCFLHNYLIQNNKNIYCPPKYADHFDDEGELVEGEWRRKVNDQSLYSSSLPSHKGRSTDEAKYYRELLKNYFQSPIGSVPWQNKAVFK